MHKGTLGQSPAPQFNRFHGKEITIQQVDAGGRAARFVDPAFITDGAMVIDGRTGQILATNYTVSNLAKGSGEGGKKHAAASAIAQGTHAGSHQLRTG